MYLSYLTDEGYKAEVRLRRRHPVQGGRQDLWIIIDEKDPRYFRLVLANVWKIESEGERRKVLVAVDFSNFRSSISKA